jgi:hypothetical protein
MLKQSSKPLLTLQRVAATRSLWSQPAGPAVEYFESEAGMKQILTLQMSGIISGIHERTLA